MNRTLFQAGPQARARVSAALCTVLFVLFAGTAVIHGGGCSGGSGGTSGTSSTSSSSSGGSGGTSGTSSTSSSSSSGAATGGAGGVCDAGQANAGTGGSGGGCSGVPGCAAAGDAGPADAGPISAPDDTWTWIDFPESKCASGTATGLGINPHAGATELMIYFEGGGECYDASTCWGPEPTADNLQGYDAATFCAAKQLHYPILDRSRPGNPFRAMNMVYVPYCTGDLHAGSNPSNPKPVLLGTQMTYFYGATDMAIFLERLVPTFPGTTHVWATGTSAGGFGTFLNFDRLSNAFPAVRIDMLDDSGPAIAAASDGGAPTNPHLSTWDYVPPMGCASCSTFADILAYDLNVQDTWSPPGRFGFLTFAEDTVISQRFGYTLCQYPTVMATFSKSLPAAPLAATYTVTNEASHVIESDCSLASDYLPWITLMVTGDQSWADVTYMKP